LGFKVIGLVGWLVGDLAVVNFGIVFAPGNDGLVKN
jgi:hypothetical protein